MQMLLYPYTEQFHLPSVFVKQGNVFCTDFKIISEVSQSSLVFHRVIAATPDQNTIFPFCLLPCKPYRLIVKNIVRAFKKVFAINDFIFKLTSFHYHKVGSDEIDCKESCKIKISAVQNVIGIWFVRNFIHGIHVDFKCFGNSFFLSDEYHFVGKFFKNPTVTAGVRLCQIAAG